LFDRITGQQLEVMGVPKDKIIFLNLDAEKICRYVKGMEEVK